MELTEINLFFHKITRRIRQFQFGGKAQLAFLEDLYVLVNDGIPANRAIEMMVDSTTGITHEVALSIAQKISEGQPLAGGMRDWFSVNVVEIIRVGEEGGVLTETLKSAVNTLQEQASIMGSLIGAISYPIMVFATACGVLVYLNLSVFGQFKLIKPLEQWPEEGKQLVMMANLVESWWWLAIVLLIALLFIVRRMMTHYIGELRPMMDTIPPFSFYRRLMAARVMETLGLLVANGVVFKSAIKVMQYQANPYIASHLVLMEHLLAMGKGNVADVLETGLISQKDILRLRVLAEVKGFEHGLIRMGVQGAAESAKTIRFIAKVAGGMILVVGALLILLIVRGVYTTAMAMGGVL